MASAACSTSTSTCALCRRFSGRCPQSWFASACSSSAARQVQQQLHKQSRLRSKLKHPGVGQDPQLWIPPVLSTILPHAQSQADLCALHTHCCRVTRLIHTGDLGTRMGLGGTGRVGSLQCQLRSGGGQTPLLKRKPLPCSLFRRLKLRDQRRDRTEPDELAVRAAAWQDYRQYLFRAALALSVRSLPCLAVLALPDSCATGQNDSWQGQQCPRHPAVSNHALEVRYARHQVQLYEYTPQREHVLWHLEYVGLVH